jgi:uncharacterized protein YndB with AHSA1/START domain
VGHEPAALGEPVGRVLVRGSRALAHAVDRDELQHDLSAGGKVAYFVTGPDGVRRQGWWHVLAVDPPHRLAFELCDPDIPRITMTVSIHDRAGGGSSMVIEAAFPSGEAMDRLLLMGFEGGLSAAVGQIDALLPELTADLDR